MGVQGGRLEEDVRGSPDLTSSDGHALVSVLLTWAADYSALQE